MPEAENRTAVFDVIGTCFSLDRPRQALIRLGAPEHALELWFAQSLRDAFGYSHAGGYAPLREILGADLVRTARQLRLNVSDEDLSGVLNAFAELDPMPDLARALELLSDHAWRLMALSNGSEASTRQLLKRARVAGQFAEVLSCDSVAVTKPNPAVYQLALQRAGSEVWMVAAHAWDIAGAARAGLRTAFVATDEQSFLGAYPAPDIVAGSLLEAAQAMIAEAPLDVT